MESSQNTFIQEIVRQVDAAELTLEYKTKLMEATLTFLQRNHDEDNEYLNRIVMRDKIWIDNFYKLGPFYDGQTSITVDYKNLFHVIISVFQMMWFL